MNDKIMKHLMIDARLWWKGLSIAERHGATKQAHDVKAKWESAAGYISPFHPSYIKAILTLLITSGDE